MPVTTPSRRGAARRNSCRPVVERLAALLWFAAITTAVAAAPTTPGGPSIRLDDAPLDVALERYQEFSGRTVLRSPKLPDRRISFLFELTRPRPEIVQRLEEVLRTNGLATFPIGNSFVVVTDGSTNAAPPELPPLPPATPRRPEDAGKPNAAPSTPARPPADVLPAGMIRFLNARPSAALDVWQELSGVTVVRPDFLSAGPITVQSVSAVSRAEATWLLEAMLRLAGIHIVRETDHLALAVPAARVAERPRFDPKMAESQALARFAPAVEWNLREVGPDALANAYASVTRRRLETGAVLPPGARFSLRTPKPLDQPEAIFALNALAWAEGCEFNLVGRDRFRLARLQPPPSDNVRRSIPPRAVRNLRNESTVRDELDRAQKDFGTDSVQVGDLLLELANFAASRRAYAEAETLYLRALQNRQKTFPQDRKRWIPAVQGVANARLLADRADEADAFLESFLHPPSAAAPELLSLRLWRGGLRARRSRWPEAIADYRTALEQDPQRASAWAELATLLNKAGDQDRFRAHRVQMLTRFKDETNGLNALLISRAGLVQPLEPPAADLALILAHRAVTNSSRGRSSFADRLAEISSRPALAGTNSSTGLSTNVETQATEFERRLQDAAARLRAGTSNGVALSNRPAVVVPNSAYLTLALAEYRVGRTAETMTWLNRMQTNASYPPIDASSLFLRALALHREGAQIQALTTLVKGLNLLPPAWPETKTNDLGFDWATRLQTQSLMNEAIATLKPPMPPGAAAPPGAPPGGVSVPLTR